MIPNVPAKLAGSPPDRPLFLVIEGLNGSGKTTTAARHSATALLLTVEQTAEAVGLSRDSVFGFLKDECSPLVKIKIGRLTRIRADSLPAFVDWLTERDDTANPGGARNRGRR